MCFKLKLTAAAFEERKVHGRRASSVPGAVRTADRAPCARPAPAASGGVALASGSGPRRCPDSSEQLDFGTPPPKALPPRRAPPLLPKVAQAPRKSADGRGAREREGVRSSWLRPAAALKFPARGAPTAAGRWRPGHAGALGGSMKGADRAYTRGPSLGWLFAKCCCCFPCAGEWLSALAPSLQRLGGLSARERSGNWG